MAGSSNIDGGPSATLLVISNGDYLLWTKPSHARPGAARWAFKNDSIAEIGYKVVVLVQAFPGGLRGELRAYAVSGDGRATELNNARKGPKLRPRQEQRNYLTSASVACSFSLPPKPWRRAKKK